MARSTKQRELDRGYDFKKKKPSSELIVAGIHRRRQSGRESTGSSVEQNRIMKVISINKWRFSIETMTT